MVQNKLFSKLKIVLISCVNEPKLCMELFVYFLYLSHLLYGICVNIFIMNQYISKTATQRARILLTDNIQSGGSCSVNYFQQIISVKRVNSSKMQKSSRMRIPRFSRRLLSDTSPKSIDREGLERRRIGTSSLRCGRRKGQGVGDREEGKKGRGKGTRQWRNRLAYKSSSNFFTSAKRKWQIFYVFCSKSEPKSETSR